MSGKTMIILALGFSIITSFLILKLNANSKEGLTTTVDHFKSIQSRLIANSGAEIYLEKMRKTKLSMEHLIIMLLWADIMI